MLVMRPRLLQDRIPLRNARFLRFEEDIGRIENFDLLDLITLLDGIDDILTFGDKPENRMLPVEVGRRKMGDKELAAICSGAGIGHREDACLVVLEAGFDLVFKTVSGSASAGAGGIPALDHKVRNDAMKCEAIVVAALGKVEIVGDGDRGFGRVERPFDVPFAGFDDDADVLHMCSIVGRRATGDQGKCQT